jgi:hypothetical protein
MKWASAPEDSRLFSGISGAKDLNERTSCNFISAEILRASRHLRFKQYGL